MRACEGCRRRKIKCDAATTNTWPCSACIRLKLHCVPPTVNYEQEFASGNPAYEPGKAAEFDGSSGSGEEEYHQQLAMQQQHLLGQARSNSDHIPFNDGVGMYHTSPYLVQGPGHQGSISTPYGGFHNPSVEGTEPYHEQLYAAPTNGPPGQSTQTPESWNSDTYSPDLIEALGELKIDETGIGTFQILPERDASLADATNQLLISLTRRGPWQVLHLRRIGTTISGTFHCHRPDRTWRSAYRRSSCQMMRRQCSILTSSSPRFIPTCQSLRSPPSIINGIRTERASRR